jgi:carbamoyltransferase
MGGKPRKPESPLTQKEMDLASSIQAVTEEIVIKLARHIQQTTGEKNLCLAGGVALNCVANGKLLREGIFENIWIQPAAGDAGGALGAALAAHHIMLKNPRTASTHQDAMQGTYLGPEFSQNEVIEDLNEQQAIYSIHTDDEIIQMTAKLLADGNAIGWMNGRMEFGPRSLGARSIIADARSPAMQKLLNLKVKYRESFRPFAPSVLAEKVSEWFEINSSSPYMLLVADVAKNKRLQMSEEENNLFGIEKLNVPKSSIPAVTHVDYSARIQTVHKETNPRYHQLISEFDSLTGCPVLVNTSFNVRGEPIVCSAKDAFRCLMGTELDALVIGNILVEKHKQDPALKIDYSTEYELD